MNRKFVIIASFLIACFIVVYLIDVGAKSVDGINAIKYNSMKEAIEDLSLDTNEWSVESVDNCTINREDCCLRSDSRIVGHARWYNGHNFVGSEKIIEVAKSIDGDVMYRDTLGWLWKKKE